MYMDKKKKKMVDKLLRILILEQNQSANSKSFWDWLCKLYFFKDLILLFVWTPLQETLG